MDHVAGYMLLNDLSARDLQFSTPQWMPGEVSDGSAPCGPALVTPDEAGPHDAIEIELRLNGEVMQSASTADLIHSVPALVSHLSGLMTLDPGRHRRHRHPRPGSGAPGSRGCGSSRATRSLSPRPSWASWKKRSSPSGASTRGSPVSRSGGPGSRRGRGAALPGPWGGSAPWRGRESRS